ncbi:hypothetical protein M3Y94_00687600 [Aphelenchoides besseyi]|nr:hypothetical protein M3Y94_00687600 [Aphelenchoides besseyi]KAI6231492.1 hypothetical protein M3Y95_00387500 [Aphelenchoides besseyi]
MFRLVFSMVFCVLLASMVVIGKPGQVENKKCYKKHEPKQFGHGFDFTNCTNETEIKVKWSKEDELYLVVESNGHFKKAEFNFSVNDCELKYTSIIVFPSWEVKINGVQVPNCGREWCGAKIDKDGKLRTYNGNAEIQCANGEKLSLNKIDNELFWATIRVKVKEVKNSKILLSGYNQSQDAKLCNENECKPPTSTTPSITSTRATSITTSTNTTAKPTTTSSTKKPTTTITTPSTTTPSTTTTSTTTTSTTTTTTTTTSTTTPRPTTQSSTKTTIATTLRPSTTRVTHPVQSPSSSSASAVGSSPKEEKSNKNLIYGIVGLLLLLLVLSAIGGCIWYWRRSKKQQKREEAEAAQRNAKRIADYQAEQKKKAEAKVEQKLTARQMRGKIVPGLPPLGPPGWEPDQIPANKFKHMGPLKWELNPPVVMEHELDKASDATVSANQPIVWADEMNLVYDIGSQVEEVYRDGKRVTVKKSAPKPNARPQPSRRSGEARNLKAIRED